MGKFGEYRISFSRKINGPFLNVLDYCTQQSQWEISLHILEPSRALLGNNATFWI